MVVGRPLFPDCRLHTVFILTDRIACAMPLRAGGRHSKAKRGKLDKIHALLPLHRDSYCSRAHCAQFWKQLREAQLRLLLLLAKEFSDRNWRVRRRVGNVSDIPRTCRCRPDSSTRHTPTRRMECESGTHSGGFAPRQGGDLHGKRERGEGVDGGDALQRVLGSARTNQPQREVAQKSRCWYKTGMVACRAGSASCISLGREGGVPVQYQSSGTTRGKCGRWWNEANRSEPEQTVHRQTGLGSSRTGPASRGETMVATQSWCGSARRASSDAHCWTRRIASCGPDCQARLTKVHCGPVEWTA